MPAGDRHHGPHVDAAAVEVDRDDRPGPRRDRGLDQGGIDVVGVGLDVDEDGFRPGPPDGPGGGEERVGGGDDLVARLQAQGQERQEQGAGPR